MSKRIFFAMFYGINGQLLQCVNVDSTQNIDLVEKPKFSNSSSIYDTCKFIHKHHDKPDTWKLTL